MQIFTNNFAKIFYIFLSSRIVVVFFVTIGNTIYGNNNNFKHSFCHWDCDWYSTIILKGYDLFPYAHIDGNAANWAFFPVFPKIVHYLSSILSVNHLSVSLLLNNVVFLFSLFYLFLYVKKIYNDDIAFTTVLLMSFSPYSIYFSVPYTESLFFLFLILVFYFMKENKWIYAGLFAALLSGTRGIGVMIVFPMLFVAIQQYGVKNLISFKTIDSYKVFLALLLAPMGLFLYMHYLYLIVGDAFAFKHIQIAWGREMQSFYSVLVDGLSKPWSTYPFYCAITTVVGISLTFILLLKKRYEEFIFMFIAILIPLSTGIVSMPRYIYTLFPIYISFALIIYKFKLSKNILLAFFSAGLAFMAISWAVGKGYMI